MYLSSREKNSDVVIGRYILFAMLDTIGKTKLVCAHFFFIYLIEKGLNMKFL